MHQSKPGIPARLNRPSCTSSSRWPLSLVTISLASAIALAAFAATDSVKSRAAITVRVETQSKGLLNIQEGRELKVEFRGDGASSEALRSRAVEPLTLAAADFDADGAMDLVSGYSVSGAGIVTLQRGNIEAFAPRDQKVYDRAAQG